MIFKNKLLGMSVQRDKRKIWLIVLTHKLDRTMIQKEEIKVYKIKLEIWVDFKEILTVKDKKNRML